MARSSHTLRAPQYHVSPSGTTDHVIAFALGSVAGFALFYIFYKLILLGILGGILVGTVNVYAAGQRSLELRKRRLRTQFFDLLESLAVAMRAGNPMFKALESAREDLRLLYSEDSDIIVEVDLILGKFQNGVSLSESFSNFADRCGLDDVISFASIYATIEGKSSRASEIVRKTQEIIADKMEIEMEIETMMTAAKTEANIMLVMPLVILWVIGSAGAGFMDAIYTTMVGRLVATVGLIMFFISYFLMKKFSNIKL